MHVWEQSLIFQFEGNKPKSPESQKKKTQQQQQTIDVLVVAHIFHYPITGRYPPVCSLSLSPSLTHANNKMHKLIYFSCVHHATTL